MSEGRRRAMEYVCQQVFTMQFILYGGTIALLLEAIALLTLEPGTAAYTVAVLNLPGLLFFMGLAAFFLYRCDRPV
jgi:hypothetical protein